MNALNLTTVFIASVSILYSIARLTQSKRKSVKAVLVINIIIQLLCASVAVHGLIGG